MTTKKSAALFTKAKRFIPGGVNSPVRAFKSVGLTPRFIARAKGAYLWDVDGNQYIDYVGSWGPMIAGHTHKEIIQAIQDSAKTGTSFGAPTELEVKMAEIICKLVPSIEMVRMVNSGTEATMSAIRLARAYTGRDKIIKFDGCYHGHGDSFLIKAGSGAETLGIPDSPGVPKALANETLTAQINNLDSVRTLVSRFRSQVSCIIIEPVVGNMGCIPPQPGFLEGLRSICDENGIVFIIDEVMTGFRVALGGAQQLYKVKADITTLGKIIGGGLPVGAYGGKKEIMQIVAPSGPVYQAGTLSGNPLAMAAGYSLLSHLSKKKTIYTTLETMSRMLEDGIRENMKKLGLGYQLNRVGSMFTLFFTEYPVRDAGSARMSDTKKFAAYFSSMLEQGIYLPPSQFEAAFISAAHGEKEIEKTIKANYKALRAKVVSRK
ncbi:MAG: glutamate-1-semialdehyde-2,1-aminomutase [Bacteroidetes bacterium]|nr:MAG: glutamate-1-semialdehyde-2,1-aminomutase [Bacteroidota bacterium]